MNTRLYVGHLSETATERTLQELFEAYGEVDEVSVLRGFGFVVSPNSPGPLTDGHVPVRPALLAL